MSRNIAATRCSARFRYSNTKKIHIALSALGSSFRVAPDFWAFRLQYRILSPVFPPYTFCFAARVNLRLIKVTARTSNTVILTVVQDEEHDSVKTSCQHNMNNQTAEMVSNTSAWHISGPYAYVIVSADILDERCTQKHERILHLRGGMIVRVMYIQQKAAFQVSYLFVGTKNRAVRVLHVL